MNSPGLRLATPKDTSFLQRVFRSCREDEFAGVPWSDGERDAFFIEQSKRQERHYDQQLPALERKVVTCDGRDVGRFYLARHEDKLIIVDIALLPSHQERGIGSSLLTGVLRLSESEGLPVSLHVETNSPARRWYERLGFREVGRHGIYVRMERTPDQLKTASRK